MEMVLSSIYPIFRHVFISLFSILNPIGMSAVFLSMTQQYSTIKRRRIAWQVAINSTIIIIVVYFTGSSILNFFGISLPSLRIAGGLVIFGTAWNMLTKNETDDTVQTKTNSTQQNDNGAFFPLTMPLTAGSGVIAVTIALSASQKTTTYNNIITGNIGALMGIIVAFITVGTCYSLADRIFLLIGNGGTKIITKLTSFIILAISIEMIFSGIRGFI